MAKPSRNSNLVIFQVYYLHNDDTLFPFEFDKNAKIPTFSKDVQELQIDAGDVCLAIGAANVLGKTSTEVLKLLLTPGDYGSVVTIRILKQQSVDHPAVSFIGPDELPPPTSGCIKGFCPKCEENEENPYHPCTNQTEIDSWKTHVIKHSNPDNGLVKVCYVTQDYPVFEMGNNSTLVTKVNNGVHIKKGYRLLEFQKEKIRPNSLPSFKKRLKKIKAGNRVTCVFLKEEGPLQYSKADTKLPEPGEFYLFCHRCQTNFPIKNETSLRSGRKHLKQVECSRKEPSDFTCGICSKVFHQREKYQSHFHTRWQNLKVDWTDFVWSGKETELKDLFQEDFVSRMTKVCTDHRISVPGFSPPIQVPHQHRKDKSLEHLFTDFANVKGVRFFRKLLREKINLGEDNQIILYRNVRVKDEMGNTLTLLPEEVTKPKSKFLVVKDIDDQRFEVSLREKSIFNPKWKVPQPLENVEELEEMKTYTKRFGGKKYPIHRWPNEITVKQNMFRQPWKMEEDEIFDYTGLDARNFWVITDALSKTQLKDSLKKGAQYLSLPSAVLLYRMKLKHNLPNKVLGRMFQLTKKTVQGVFLTASVCHYGISNGDLKAWTDPELSDQEKSRIYRSLTEGIDPFFIRLISSFEDPTGKKRIPVPLCLDSTKIFTQKSKDARAQQKTFYDKHKMHMITATNVSSIHGRVVYSTCFSNSMSPRHGDSILAADFLKRRDEGLENLFRGNSEFFCVVMVDRGYVYDPHNLKTDNKTFIHEWAKTNGAVVVSPETNPRHVDYVFQMDETTQKFREVKIADLEDPESVCANHKKICGTLRKSIEQQFSSMKQDKFWSGTVHRRYLQCLSKNTASKLKLKQSFAELPLVQCLWACSIAQINGQHKSFHIKFASKEEQIRLARLFKARLNLVNPFCSDEISYEFDISKYPLDSRDEGWTSIPLCEIDDDKKFNGSIEGFKLPTLEPDDMKAVDNLNLGNYWSKLVGMYFTLLRQRELLPTRDQFQSREEEIQAYKTPPETTIVKFRVMKEEPTGEWDTSKFGEFPKDGLLCAYIRLCSTNRSMDLPANDRQVMLCFAKEPNKKLHLPEKLKNLWGWYCASTIGADVCNRYCGTGAHTISFLLLLAARKWYNAKVVSENRLYETDAPENLQPGNPWSSTGITPVNSSSQLGTRYTEDTAGSTESLDENNDMERACEYFDPILALGEEFYGEDGDQSDVSSVESDFEFNLPSDNEDNTFYSAHSNVTNVTHNDTMHSALDSVSVLNDDSRSPYFLPKSVGSIVPSGGPQATSTPGRQPKRPTSPLVSNVAKKPATQIQTVAVTQATFRPRRQSVYKPPFKNSCPDVHTSVNQALEETRRSLSQTGIASSSVLSHGVNVNPQTSGHQLIPMEDRTRQWPSWVRMFNPRNACWLNSPTNGLIWTLKSQGVSSIGMPPNTAPGRWTPLDFFKHYFSLNVGAHASPELLLKKLASRKRQPELTTEQFPAEKLFEIRECTDAFYRRLCPLLHINNTTTECRFCHEEEFFTDDLSVECLMSLSFEDGVASYTLQNMIDSHIDSEFESDCVSCGREDSVTRTTKIQLRDPRDGIIICLKRVKFVNGIRRKIFQQVEIPDEIQLPLTDGGYETYVFNCCVEHLGDVHGGHYKLHVKDPYGYATINDDRQAVPTNEVSVKKSTLFFYGKRRFYDDVGAQANTTNEFPSLHLDISMEVDLAAQQSLLEQQVEDERVKTRKKKEREEKRAKARARTDDDGASTSQNSSTGSSIRPMTRGMSAKVVPEDSSAFSVSSTGAVTLVANNNDETKQEMKAKLYQLTKGEEYHLFYAKTQAKFEWLIFGLAGIISTMKKAGQSMEKPKPKDFQETTLMDCFRLTFHLEPGEIVDFSAFAKKLSDTEGRQDLFSRSQSVSSIFELDIFAGDDRPWKVLVPRFVKRSFIDACKCPNRSQNYEREEYIEPCPFKVTMPRKLPKGKKVPLQSLVDLELEWDKVEKCDGCRRGKVSSENELLVYDGAEGIIITIDDFHLSKKAKKSGIQINDTIHFNNCQNDQKVYYKLVAGIEEKCDPEKETLNYHFKSMEQVVTIFDGDQIKLGQEEDFERCQVFFYRRIQQQSPDSIEDQLMEWA